MTSHVNGTLSPLFRRLRAKACNPFVTGRVLDFGCNIGALSEEVTFDTYTGIDVEAQALEKARILHPDLTFLHADDDLGDRVFDTIVMMAVIEYVANRVALFDRLAGYLAPGGRLIITSPDPAILVVRAVGGRLGLLANDERHLRRGLPSAAQICCDLAQVGLIVNHRSRFMLGFNHLIVAGHPA